jgi:hypothetical protein
MNLEEKLTQQWGAGNTYHVAGLLHEKTPGDGGHSGHLAHNTQVNTIGCSVQSCLACLIFFLGN